MIWTDTVQQLAQFLLDLNRFNLNLKFTHQQSTSTIDFLDITIYKGPLFPFSNILDVKTFQKQLNLFQYLHFSSNHPKNVFKAIIKGECIRYIKTNSTKESYRATVFNFKKCLLQRGYPAILVEKTVRTVNSYLPTIQKFPGLYRKIGCHPGIPEILYNSRIRTATRACPAPRKSQRRRGCGYARLCSSALRCCVT